MKCPVIYHTGNSSYLDFPHYNGTNSVRSSAEPTHVTIDTKVAKTRKHPWLYSNCSTDALPLSSPREKGGLGGGSQVD